MILRLQCLGVAPEGGGQFREHHDHVGVDAEVLPDQLTRTFKGPERSSVRPWNVCQWPSAMMPWTVDMMSSGRFG